MNTSIFKRGVSLAVAIALVIALLFQTCEGKQKHSAPPSPTQDTTFYSQWRHEKKEKKALIDGYEKKIAQLQKENTALSQTVLQSKAQLKSSRTLAQQSQARLHQAIIDLVGTDSLRADTMVTLLENSETASLQNDNACDTVIEVLERRIINRDSVIELQTATEIELLALSQKQEMINLHLEQQLDKSVKQERKKSRQVKWLGRGIILLTGIATSLFIIQKVR